MRIFINDIPVRIVRTKKILPNEFYHVDIDVTKENIVENKLIHHTLIRNINVSQLDWLLHQLHKFELQNLYSLTLTTNEMDKIILFLEGKYKIIRAAGGVVRKKDKKLVIYRLKKWDLPKGKLEKGEDAATCAIREVEEECGVKVKLVDKLCITRHTYTMKNKDILKKTDWFVMDCLDDSKKKPQKEEDIEEVKWMNPKEIHHAMQDSYQSIRHVFRKYYDFEEKQNKLTADKVKSP